MQAIGFLSRREYSRQELRLKLLAALRQREREAAMAAAQAASVERVLHEMPGNGIDDAFMPRGERPDSGIARAGRRSRGGAADGAFGTRADHDDHDDHDDPVEFENRSNHDAPDDGTSAPRRLGRCHDGASGAGIDALPRPPMASLCFADGRAAPLSLLAAPVGAGMAGARTATHLRSGGSTREEPATLDTGPSPGCGDDADETLSPEQRVDQLIDWLEAQGYLSDVRFVESRVHARAGRQGVSRIKHEIERHGLALESEQLASLRASEFARAHTVWQRKFGAVAADARERARQERFLAARGFAADVVRRLVGGQSED